MSAIAVLVAHPLAKAAESCLDRPVEPGDDS
jgi:hypothetical protein